MQSDVPPLPISCLIDTIRENRNRNFKSRLVTKNSRDNSLSKSTPSTVQLLSNRKQLRPLIVGPSPYKNSARFNPTDTAKSTGKSVINQRVSSAKMLRIKQLQNQLADAHFNLNELSNENKLLKAIQKRQDAALKRYEGTNAELPRIINTHHEDLRVLQTKYKKLRSQHKETCDILKERENELHTLQVQNKKLLQLSKDRHLGEREKLQSQVSDLNHRISQQDETIQTLKRKLSLETKYLKHQLNAEMTKHKETQKLLEDTQDKVKSLEKIMEQRERRSYQSSRMVYYGKPTVTSQSLTNLSESRTENLIKGNSNLRRRRSEAITGQSLPSLNGTTSLMRSQSQDPSQKLSQETPVSTTETFVNFEQLRNFRLQKSPALQRASFSTSRGSLRDSPIKESQLEENETKVKQAESRINLNSGKKLYELPKSLKKEYNYASDDDDDNSNDLENDSFNLASRSRSLHARLVSSATEGIRTNKTQNINRSRSLTKENIDNIIENERETNKYDRDSVITVISRDVLNDVDTHTNYSSSDIESEMEIPIAFNTDEDENVIRKSDIVIDEVELEKEQKASSHYSKLFNQFQKPSNYSFTKGESNKTRANEKIDSDKIELKSVNGLSIHSEVITRDYGKSVENIVAQKKSVPKEEPIKTPWDDDEYLKNLPEEELNLSLNKLENTSPKSEEEVLKNFSEIDKKTEDLENIVQKDKSNTLNQKESGDVKNQTEQKTAIENSKAFDKAKLLAAMKAIDDNENIEFIEQKPRRNSGANRMQITENLYRGIPTHSKKKSDIMKELFTDTKLDNNSNGKEN